MNLSSTADGRTPSPHQQGTAAPAPTGPSALEVEFDRRVTGLLTRLAAEESVATGASSAGRRDLAWPSWSTDTGLTRAQETFVEAWSPRRVTASIRADRRLVEELQHWTRSHRDDLHVDEALTVLATVDLRYPG